MGAVAGLPIDALLVVSFGGPEHPEDVMGFLENVTAGRDVPRERLEEVAEHYLLFGGKSPINDQNRELVDEIRKDLANHGLDLPVYWGNRNWHPFLRDTMRQMADDGVRHAAYFLTSAYSSYSGCRQYRENLYEAATGVELELSHLPLYFDHAGFVTPFVEATSEALAGAGGTSRWHAGSGQRGTDAHVVFVTHSIPTAMDAASGGPGQHAYVRQHEKVAALVAERSGAANWSLAYCSRSGSPHQPWLEPDINDHLRELSTQGVESVVVVPIGFISDHTEVVFDLDTEAAQTAAGLRIDYVRVSTPGVHPAFVTMVRELLAESPRRCPADCCVDLRAPLPTIP